MRSIRKRCEAAASAGALAGAIALLNGLSCASTLPAPIPSNETPETAPRRGGTLHLASIEEPRGFDPATSSDGLSTIIINLLFEGLVDYDENTKIVPVLAERWEVTDGGKTYRFFLREGVRFHDGNELTAEDVKRSVERALHPTTPSAWASQFAALEGFTEYTEKNAEHLSGVVVEGRYAVSFRLSRPDAAFLAYLALYPIRPVCKSAGDRYAPGWHPCGAGPFKLPPDGWRRGVSVDVVRHDAYFRPGLPYLDGIRLQLLVNPITQRFKFVEGELDFFRDGSGPDVTRFSADPRWAALGDHEIDRIVSGEAMNVEMPPFDNVEIRRAIAAAIDREHYRLLKPTSIRVADQPIPPAVPGHDKTLHGQRYDYAAALEHMRRAGYPYDPATGTGGYPHVVEYLTYGASFSQFSAQVLKQELAKIGIRVEVKLVSYPAFIALSQKRKRTPFLLGSWNQDYPDPSDFLDVLFSSESINEDQSQNTAFYRNDELDALLKRARTELDQTARMAMYRTASQIVCDEAPWAFTHYYHHYSVKQPYLRGYKPHPVAVMHMANVWLDRAAVKTAQRSLLRSVPASVLGGAR